MGSKKAVIDTNVIVSGMVFGGIPAEIMRRASSQDIKMITCEQLLIELGEVLRRPKLRLSEEDTCTILDLIRDFSSIVLIAGPCPKIALDPDDDIVLECAKSSLAEYIITGDAHLLQLRVYHWILIITPSQFLSIKE